jgi:hypothetical protein
VAAFYWSAPTAADLAGTAYRVSDYKPPDIDLWPENDAPFALFAKYQTQWRVGMNGPVGLDYSVFLHDLDRRGISGEEHDEIMDAIRVIEGAALNEIHKS